jgi:hypothetical protein
MLKYLHIIICFLLLSTAAMAQVTAFQIKGVYQGRNLYIQNPFTPAGVGFCTHSVTVNGEHIQDRAGASAFEIDLSTFQLKIGDPVVVTVEHNSGCTPKILNPFVLRPKSTFKMVRMGIDAEEHFEWTTTNEKGNLEFIVEQFRWNKWIKVGAVLGKGTPGEHTYHIEIPFNSGMNKMRVKQIDYTGKPTYSRALHYTPLNQPKITRQAGLYVGNEIVFSAKTKYEVYDSYGNLLKRGNNTKVDVSNLKRRRKYYLNYDNKAEMFETR